MSLLILDRVYHTWDNELRKSAEERVHVTKKAETLKRIAALARGPNEVLTQVIVSSLIAASLPVVRIAISRLRATSR